MAALEKSLSVVSLLSTPMSSNLGEARKDLLTSPPSVSTLSIMDFGKMFRHAVVSGDSECVHNLLRTPRQPPFDINTQPPPICVAASKGYVDIVALLIRHGADVNIRSSEDSTALLYAADNGFLNVLALLLNAGAKMNVLNRNGETALARATRRGWVQCARLLLAYGANPNPMATDGHSLVVSPLHLAHQMHQSAIEKHILTRTLAMENTILQLVKATLPKHISLLEPGHLVDTKTSSFFPVQLVSDNELSRFVLYFKTPPGYSQSEVEGGHRGQSSTPSDELILIYIVRVQLTDGHMTNWLTGPSFDYLSLSFNGSRRYCTRMPGSAEYPGLCVFAVSCQIKPGGLNTLCLVINDPSSRPKGNANCQSIDNQSPSTSPMALVGAYRVHIDVTSLIQTSAGLTFGGSSKPTIYIPRSMS